MFTISGADSPLTKEKNLLKGAEQNDDPEGDRRVESEHMFSPPLSRSPSAVLRHSRQQSFFLSYRVESYKATSTIALKNNIDRVGSKINWIHSLQTFSIFT
jgi:hypothetical protein